MNARQIVLCPYCKKPLPLSDHRKIRAEVIQTMPEEADRDFIITHSCGAWLLISPEWNVTIRHKPLPRRVLPSYGTLLSQGKSPSEVAEIIAAYPNTKNLKGKLVK